MDDWNSEDEKYGPWAWELRRNRRREINFAPGSRSQQKPHTQLQPQLQPQQQPYSVRTERLRWSHAPTADNPYLAYFHPDLPRPESFQPASPVAPPAAPPTPKPTADDGDDELDESWHEFMDRFVNTIRQMMYVSGETAEPPVETTSIIEDIVRQQVIELVGRPRFPVRTTPQLRPNTAEELYRTRLPARLKVHQHQRPHLPDPSRPGQGLPPPHLSLVERRAQKRQRLGRQGCRRRPGRRRRTR